MGRIRLAALTLGITLATAPVFAATTGSQVPADIYEPTFRSLFILFVLAVLLESGLAVLFQWKPVLATFDSRAARPLFSFVAALILVISFKLDIATELLNLFTNSANGPNAPGIILTALVISGGSSGINRIFQALGFRPMTEQEQPETSKPPPTEAWISITPVRKDAVGPIYIQRTYNGKTELVGSVAGRSSAAFYRFLLRDKGRFPPSGGFALVPGNYTFRLAGEKSGQGEKIAVQSDPWGPYDIAAGAIIDITLKL